MPDRKSSNQSWEGFVEQQIHEAEEQGQFENLPGAGCPIPGIEQPLKEDWWLKEKLKREQLSVLPPLLQARQDIERTLQEIHFLRSPEVVRTMLEQLNQRILEAIRSPLPSPPIIVMPVNIENEMHHWKVQKKKR